MPPEQNPPRVELLERQRHRWITQDRGYKSAELQESYAIGEIPIDAIYTPIERVNFKEVPMPYSKNLEVQTVVTVNRIADAIRKAVK